MCATFVKNQRFLSLRNCNGARSRSSLTNIPYKQRSPSPKCFGSPTRPSAVLGFAGVRVPPPTPRFIPAQRKISLRTCSHVHFLGARECGKGGGMLTPVNLGSGEVTNLLTPINCICLLSSFDVCLNIPLSRSQTQMYCQDLLGPSERGRCLEYR